MSNGVSNFTDYGKGSRKKTSRYFCEQSVKISQSKRHRSPSKKLNVNQDTF